jgi:type I restriction-modification system DNA methylase subunit
MMRSKQEIKDNIKELVTRYKSLEKKKGRDKLKDISEANVRSDFIDDLFEILGWEIKNPDEYDRENYIRGVGYADVALQLDDKPVIFVEAKRFGSIPEVDRETTDWIDEERQVMNYAASPERKIPWAVLTNFEKLRVFNALNGLLVLEINGYWEYTERLDELLYLHKESVQQGRLDALGTREERPDIDEQFLENLEKWRLMLANDIYEKNKDNHVLRADSKLDFEALKSAVQRILDRLIVVRYAEDRLILDNPDQLKSITETWEKTSIYTSLYELVKNFFRGFDRIHNSKLFEQGHISEAVEVGSEALADIIDHLYDINFRKFDFDVLGNTYETYLGHELYLTDESKLDLKSSRGIRKESGIYYTPPYVVDYIVKNTMGEFLRDKNPDEVDDIKVLDPACGSGSFLIKAYDYFEEYYQQENQKRREEIGKKIKTLQKKSDNYLEIFDNSHFREIEEYEKKILEENLYGIDLDEQAAEIASVNLVLKALKKGEKLPLILGENIRVGNTLISGTEEELREYFGDTWEKKVPFRWENEFNGILGSELSSDKRGFDILIGNPPYVTIGAEKKEEQNYFVEKYKTPSYKINTFILFIERAINLLRNGGKMGFIIPRTILFNAHMDKIRKFVLDNCKISIIVEFKESAFKDAEMGGNIILILQKELDEKERKNNEVQINKVRTLGSLALKNLDRHYLPQDLYYNENRYRYYTFSKEVYIILEKITKNSSSLEDICKIKNGLNPGNIRHILISEEKKDERYKKLIAGRDISRYSLDWSGFYVCYDSAITKDLTLDDTKGKSGMPEQKKIDFSLRNKEIFLGNKIVIRKTADNLIATLDENEYFHDTLVHNIKIKDDVSEEYKLKYILALLNSNLINFYYKMTIQKSGKIFAKVAITDLKKMQIKNAPISKQNTLSKYVDEMLTYKEKAIKLDTDFEHHIDLYPRTDDTTLGKFLDKLDIDVGEMEVINQANRREGKVTEFEVAEKGEWLEFTVEFEEETKRGKTRKAKFKAFRCKIENEKIRKFIYRSIKEFLTPSKISEGNLYESILKIKIPRFHENWKKNIDTINEIMAKYTIELNNWNELQNKIKNTDNKIDDLVYDLYELTDEEIKIVEESFDN